jgi:type IV fimbrial biogenesis protein FimT
MLTKGTRRAVRGLTLVELMVVLAVVAVGAMLAAPGLASVSANYRVRSTAESILAGLNFARTEAVRRNTAVSFSLTSNGWSVAQVSPSETLQARAAPAGGVTVTPDGTAQSVTFLATGLTATGTQLRQVTVASSLAGADTRQISIFGGGLIRMCDPAVTTAGDPRRC